MIIVYQSLESVGNTEDTSATAIIGNSFKRKVHETLQNNAGLMGTVQKKKEFSWDFEKGEVETKTVSFGIPVATKEESEALYKTYKQMGEAERKKNLVAFLTAIVQSIVANTSNCTKPPNNPKPHVRAPDVIVFGEIYGSELKGAVIDRYVVVSGMNPTRDARHRFMVLVRTGPDGKTPYPGYARGLKVYDFSDPPNKLFKDEKAKCTMIKVRGWLIALVHVPNAICNKPDRAATYLHNNVERVQQGGKLDLIMGDTNQGTRTTVENYMNGAYHRQYGTQASPQNWSSSISGQTQAVRGYTSYEVLGTNTVYNTHFDIACTHQAYAKVRSGLKIKEDGDDEISLDLFNRCGIRVPPNAPEEDEDPPAFLFHGLTEKLIPINGRLFAYSDHNGVIVEILRDSSQHQLENKKRSREEAVEEHASRKRLRLDTSLSKGKKPANGDTNS
jgi:hypothetical protein